MVSVTYQDNIPMRLDRYLNINYKITHGIIEKLLRKGLITVSGNKCKASVRLNKGDIVDIADFIVNDRSKSQKNNHQFSDKVITFATKYFNSWIIYEDENLIAINKPGDISTQGGTKVNLSIDHILQYLNHINDNATGKFRLVHRLDKKTTGILLIAKNREAAIKLTTAFKESKIKKIYVAVLKGTIAKEKGTITSILDGKKSITNYSLMAKKSPDINLVIFKPITGRKHQLRKHALELGCYIIGDSSKKNEPMFLHALQILIDKEVLGNEIIINTEIPKIFTEYIQFDYKKLGNEIKF